MFGKAFKSAKKIQNQQIMEAVVAGCMLVAMADGTLSKAEREKMDKLLSTNDQLSAFKPSEIRKVMQRFENQLDADFGVGKKRMLDQIGDISDNSDSCEEVFLNMLAIAKADGEVEPAEAKVLQEVARLLGINLAEYNIAA
jgi:tellurite resistance protein TerB